MTEVVKAPDNDRDQFFVKLVNEYQGVLLHMCYVSLRDQELAKDAVQETFLKAYRSLPTFRGESSEKTWLIQIALNTCRSMQRSAWLRHHDRRITPEDVPQPVWMPPEEDMDVLCDIMRLPPKLKEVIMLYYWQDMSVSEIAQSLSISQSTVSRRLQHARNVLRDVLDRRYHHGRPQGEADRPAGV